MYPTHRPRLRPSLRVARYVLVKRCVEDGAQLLQASDIVFVKEAALIRRHVESSTLLRPTDR